MLIASVQLSGLNEHLYEILDAVPFFLWAPDPRRPLLL